MTRGSGTSRPWPMPDAIALTAYARQIEAARAVGLSMTRTQAQAFLRILEAYAEELSARVAAGIATRTQEQSLAMAREIIRQMVRDLAVATGHGVRVTSDRVADIYAQATGDLLRSDPAGAAFTGTLFPALNTSAAQAVLSRPELSAAFVTIRRESVIAVDKIIQRAILRGATSTRTAMELRLHVLGADALPADLLLDRRRIGYDAIQAMGYEPTRENLLLVRKNAGQVAAKAQLIARTEPMNAEWEAHMQAAAASPVVAAIHWKLSHRHKDVDACDLFAIADWYGLGAGIYDPRMVPPRPHPRCLCYQEDVIAPVSQWGKARGTPPVRRLEVADLVNVYELSPSQEAMVARALVIGEGRMLQQAAA